MGSLATVKVLREKTPTEITKNLLKDISSKSQSATMGLGLSRPATNNPPENLNINSTTVSFTNLSSVENNKHLFMILYARAPIEAVGY